MAAWMSKETTESGDAFEASDLAKWFHSAPHKDFSLDSTTTIFSPTDRDYNEALLMLAAFIASFGVLLLVIFLIYYTWCFCTCCRKPRRLSSETYHSRRSCLQTFIIILGVICCGAVILGFVFNGKASNGVDQFRNAVDDIEDDINNANSLGNVLKERTTDIENLLGQISDLPEVSSALNETRKMLSNLDYLNGLLPQTVTHDASDVGDDVHHYDNYRWFVTVVVLTWCVFLCIYSFWIGCQTTDCVMAMLTILCLSSVLFTWIVLGGDFGIATGIGDLCVHPVKSMEQIKKGNPAVVEYYANCNEPDPFKNNLSLLEKEVEILRDLIENIPGQKSVTRRILNALDNVSYRLPRYEESFTCLKIHTEYMNAMDGLCNKALNSLALVMLSLVILAFVSGLMTCAVCPLWRYRKSYDRAYPNVTVNRERMGNDDILWWPHGAETNTEETHLRRQGNVTHDERSPLIANQHQPYYETVNHSNLNNIQPNSSSNGPAADGRYARGDGQNISHKPGDYQVLPRHSF